MTIGSKQWVNCHWIKCFKIRFKTENTVNRNDKSARSRSIEQLKYFGSGGCGECDAGIVLEEFAADFGNLEVVRPVIVAPFAHTVRLVDDQCAPQVAHEEAVEHLPEAGRHELLRRHVEERVGRQARLRLGARKRRRRTSALSLQVSEDGRSLLGCDLRVHSGTAHAAALELRDLVGDEAQQR